MELRLPTGASVSMVVRDHETFVPERRTVLRHGDDLLVVPRRLRWRTEERLRQVSAHGRLAQWLGGRKPGVRAEPAGGVPPSRVDRRAADLDVLPGDDAGRAPWSAW